MDIYELKNKMLSESKGSLISELGDDNKEWLSTPAYDLNRILSGSLYKTVQIGTHTAFVGPEASGKSSIMALLLADAQQKGYLPLIIDAEGAWDLKFVQRWGIDPKGILRIPTLWIDDILVELSKLTDKNIHKLAIAIDSIGALELKKVIIDGATKNDVKADQGRLQKDIKRLLKMIVGLVKFNDCVAFSAGHYYGNPTGYGAAEAIGGGKYYKLSCDSIVSLKKAPIYENPDGKSNEKRGKVIGNSILAATLKNRKYPPFLESTVEINYENGVNSMAGLVEIALEMGLIKAAGAWYSCEDLQIKSQGKSKLYNDLSEKKDEFLTIIESYLKTTGYSIRKNINLEIECEKE